MQARELTLERDRVGDEVRAIVAEHGPLIGPDPSQAHREDQRGDQADDRHHPGRDGDDPDGAREVVHAGEDTDRG